MSPETQEFGAIYIEIQKEFAGDPNITVKPTAGDPPSQYEITYNIPSAVKTEEGDITIDNQHVITISIPFGFPHFSPSCKPKSAVFHPDFDTAAICLGNYWNRERTLPELIRHIGRMISGELFSTENAFNEEAVTWFLDHRDDLPFSSASGPSLEPEPELTLEEEESEELDILEDQDFLDEIDFTDDEDLIADDQPAEVPPPPPSPPSTGFDASAFMRMAQQKNFHQLDTELGVLDPAITFPEREELLARTSTALTEARELYSIAEEFEDAGNSQKAMEAFRQVEGLVADYPGIRDDIQRSEQSAEMLSEINGKLHSDDDSQGGDLAFDSMPELPEEETPPAPKPEKKKVKMFEDSTKKSLNIVPLVAAGAVLCIVVTLTYYYFSLTGKLTEAKQLYSECTAQFSGKDFHAAEKSCLASLETTTSIFLVHGSEKSELQASIRKILNSEELRQGLLGNVLHNGRYVPLSLLEAHQSFFDARTKGDSSFEQQAWKEAITSYQNAINIARKTRDIPATDLLEIEKKLKEAEFYSKMRDAEAAVNSQDWPRAVEMLTALEGELPTLEATLQPEYQQKIKVLIAQGQFARLKKQADVLFSQSDWAGAFDMFQQAIQAGQSLSDTEPGAMDTLQQNVAKAELYSTINAGNKAFAEGKWDEAITDYQKAKQLLSTNAALLNIEDSNQSHRKIDRIILQSALLRERQSADRHKEEGDYEAALRNLQDMVNHIKYGNFNDDPEFVQILKETQDTQAGLRDEMFVTELSQYLLDNYAALFLENYPAASPDTLSNPSVTFMKRLGSRYLFKMQCTETSRGRPLKLIMFYAYNPVTDKWQFYSEKQ